MEIKMTSARQFTLDELQNADTHLTAIQIHEKLKDKLPSLNLSTVYRTLDYLVEKLLISVSDIGLGSPVYEPVSAEIHHHLVCLKCHRIMDLEHEAVADFFEKIKNEMDFKILTNHLVLYGHCTSCQE